MLSFVHYGSYSDLGGSSDHTKRIRFVRNNRQDLVRCIPLLLIYKGIPFIHSLIIPFYIYYARHMLPSTYKFFEEVSYCL